jgi:hypothetical protein
MRMLFAAMCLVLVALPACRRGEKDAANVAPAQLVKEENPAATATEARVSGGLPGDRTPLSEPKGAIDPKSTEAAGQVVQHFGALIEEGRWVQAAKLWGDPATAVQTTSRLKRDYSEVHLEIGKPGDSEGAAGSIYITVPVLFYGKTKSGEDFRRSAGAILRRVNDVPGSTDEQRRWHIERIEWDRG